MKDFFAQVDDHIKTYENGTITISDDIEFSMRKTVRKITHYILSRYMDGGANENKDPLTGKRRPFRNVGNAIVDIEWRAKNIDRKNIEGHATDGDYVFSLIVNKELQLWMKNSNFGKVIDDYQRKKSEYGNVLLKKTERDGKLLIEPVQWENVYVDPNNIAGGMKVEKSVLTLLDLKKRADLWTEQTDGELSIDVVIAQAKKRKERDVEILDIEGEFEYHDIFPEADEQDNEIGLYNVIVARIGTKKYCLYKTKLKETRYKFDRRKDVEGRDWGLGVWEECFEPQISTNEMVIAERDVMEVAGKVLIKTNKKDARSAMDMANGEMIDLDANEFFDALQLTPQSLPKFQQIVDAWFLNMQRDQSAFPAVTGEESKAGTPFAADALHAAQAGSIFNKRRDQDGYFLLEVVIDWALPFCIKQIDKDHTLDAAYSPKELELIDEAIREYFKDKVSKDALLSDEFMQPGMPFGTLPEDRELVGMAVQEQLDKNGSNRTLKIPKGYITLAKIKQKVRFDITDEMSDDQRRLNALATALGQLPAGDPARGPIIQEMMEISGISAASFPITGQAQTTPAPKTRAPSRVEEVLPEGQQI